MSVANKIFSNTLWQVIIRTINILIGVFSLALITRILGQTGFGFYTTVFAFVQMFMILADLGLYLALLREISSVEGRKQESKVVNNIFTIRLIASLAVLVFAPLVVQVFPYDQAVKTGVIFFSFAFFFQSLVSTLTAVFSKKLAMPKVAIVDLFNKLIFFLSLAYLFTIGGDLNTILIIASVVNGLSFVLLCLFLRKYVSLNLAWDFKYWKKIFYYTWPLAVTVVLNLVYFKADTLVLSIYHSLESVALYGAPYRVLEVLVTFPHMFMSLILPLFTAAWIKNNIDKVRGLFQNTFDLFSIIVVAMIAGTWLVSKPIMILLAGQEFAASGSILNILVLATASIFFGTLLTYLVVALQIQRQMIKYFLISAIVGMIGYFIFIPLYSYWGAAYMTLLVEVLIWIFAYMVIRKHIQLKLKYNVLLKSVLAGILMFIAGWLIKDINIILTILVSAVVYILTLYFTKAVDKQLIKEVFKRKNI